MGISGSNQLTLFRDHKPKSGPFVSICKALGVELKPNWVDSFGAAIRGWFDETIRKPIRTLSLFSGAGGLDIGFHDGGFKIETMVEIEQRFVDTLRANCGHGKFFSEATIYCGDIRDYHPSEKLRVDFIIGGPPCQSFSAAGRRAAGVQGTADERGALFEEYVRLLKRLLPKGFLFENVYGITGAEKGKAWEKICEAFLAAGYKIAWRILDAADYGVPQHRERMFIVGAKGEDFKFPFPTHGPDSPDNLPYVTAAHAFTGVKISDAEIKAKVKGRFGDLLDEIPPGLNYSFFTEKMGHPSPIFAWRSKFSDFLYKADPKSPIRTLQAQGGQYTGPFHWENRPFAIAELKRLQTFPDSYEIVGGRGIAIHQIGNSVPPQLSRVLALSVLNQVFNVKLPSLLPFMESGEVLGFRKRKRSLTEIYRSKARAAITNIDNNNGSKRFKDRSFKAHLWPDFGWKARAGKNASLRVRFVPRKLEWNIHVSPLDGESDQSFSITITPVLRTNWALPVPKVMLSGAALAKDVFTGGWKAFEDELIRFNIKADLVQLCGYYQYKPNFRCKVTYNRLPVPKEWAVLKAVVEGIGVGDILAYEEIANLWKIHIADVVDIARWLRELGYEVRNHQTNPQIPLDCLLVPYVFPTLTPLSVQLRKSLENTNAKRKRE